MTPLQSPTPSGNVKLTERMPVGPVARTTAKRAPGASNETSLKRQPSQSEAGQQTGPPSSDKPVAPVARHVTMRAPDAAPPGQTRLIRSADPLTGAGPVALCSTESTQVEWVPDREQHVVPAAMAQLCQRCPLRPSCLVWAVETESMGYWAGTTTADRVALVARQEVSIAAAEAQQAAVIATELGGAVHEPECGSLQMYRKGCRCLECRQHNAAARAQERARSRLCRAA